MTILVVMRLAEMRRIHPAQIESVCDGCGQKVGIYPSGQNIIAADPRTGCCATIAPIPPR